ncbi:MAG: hypothetical protein WAM30_19610 [Candidatus Dormiibacterota bacterium]
MQDEPEATDAETQDGENGPFSVMEGRVRQANDVAQDVLSAALPADPPAGWRALGHSELVGAILRDWSKNSTTELVDEDTTNLTGFARIAAEAGLRAPDGLGDATFTAVLRGLLDDWVANWSGGDEEEEEG